MDTEYQEDRESLEDALIQDVKEAIRDESESRIRDLTQELHPADMAALLGILPSPARKDVLQAHTARIEPEVLTYLDDEIMSDVVEVLGDDKVAEAICELENDDAVSVIEELDAAHQQLVLDALQNETIRADVEEGLAYPEETAGRLMQKRFVSAPEFWDVGQVIDYLREAENLPEDFYEIIVVNPRYHPVGTVMISRIMQNKREVKVRDLMNTALHPIRTDTDQEEVAEMFRRYAMAEAPVINEQNRVVGVITIDDIVHVIKEEEEEDFMRAGGILEQDIHSGLMQTVRKRLPWLVVNLLTASIAAWVIGQFETTIEQMVTLAVLMPVIASLAGNAGTQSLTVAVRGIATRELQRHNAVSVIRKEMFTNMVNAVVLSLVTSLIIWLVYQNIELAMIFSVAVIGTLTLAGLAGAFIPLLLEKLNIDPAIASGVFLTTLTDTVSFFSFLGLAAWLLL